MYLYFTKNNLTFFVLLLLIFIFLLLQYPLKNDKWYKIETHNIVIYLYRWEAPNFNVLNYGLTTLFLYGRRIDYSTSCCFQVFRLWFCWRVLSRVSSSELYFVVYLLVLVYCIVLYCIVCLSGRFLILFTWRDTISSFFDLLRYLLLFIILFSYIYCIICRSFLYYMIIIVCCQRLIDYFWSLYYYQYC